jgi:peroxiredoxin
MPVTVKAGEVTQVQYGGDGRQVVGQVEGNVNWLNDVHSLVLKQAPVPVPRVEDFATVAAFEKARDTYSATESARQKLYARSYQLQFDTDGSFHIDDVPPGTYELRIRATEPLQNEGDRWNPAFKPKELASLVREVVVPAGTDPLDLGMFRAVLAGGVTAAATVTLHAHTLDGKPISLADFRGKQVVLAFWAPWSERSTAALADVQSLQRQFAQDKRIAFLNVSVDPDAEVARKVAQEHGYTWTQAQLEGKALAEATVVFGVDTLPAIFLVDPAGHAVARDLDPERLRRTVARVLK